MPETNKIPTEQVRKIIEIAKNKYRIHCQSGSLTAPPDPREEEKNFQKVYDYIYIAPELGQLDGIDARLAEDCKYCSRRNKDKIDTQVYCKGCYMGGVRSYIHQRQRKLKKIAEDQEIARMAAEERASRKRS